MLSDELASLLNRHSRENESNTPDFILAAFMLTCLHAFNTATNTRETWYGRKTPASVLGVTQMAPEICEAAPFVLTDEREET